MVLSFWLIPPCLFSNKSIPRFSWNLPAETAWGLETLALQMRVDCLTGQRVMSVVLALEGAQVVLHCSWCSLPWLIIYVYTYVTINNYIYIICVSVCILVIMYACRNICMCIYIYVCVCVVYICECVCVCICILILLIILLLALSLLYNID